MPIFYPDYKIAPGWNNFGGLTSIESIEPDGDRPFIYPAVYGNFLPGERTVRADGLTYIRGFASTAWTFSFVTKAQHWYLQVNYGNYGYSGKVTVQTRTENPDFYQIFNAILIIPFLTEPQRRARVLVDYRLRFTRMVAIGQQFDDGFDEGFAT